MNFGRTENVHMGKADDEREYLPYRYLLWTLRNLLEIINRTSE